MNDGSTRFTLLLLAMPAGVADDAPASHFIVHFSSGPAWDPARSPGEQPGFREHSANLNRLRSDGKILFGARYDDYGMLVVKAGSADAATALFADDPGVQSGIFEYQVAALNVFYPWQDPASVR